MFRKQRIINGEPIELKRFEDTGWGKLVSLWPIITALFVGLVTGISSYVSIKYQLQDHGKELENHDVRIARIEDTISKIDTIDKNTSRILRILGHRGERGDDHE